MNDFNPGEARMRAGWEPAPGVKAPTLSHHMRFKTEGLANEAELVELESLAPGAQKAEGLPSKIATNGQTDFELDAEGHVIPLAQAQQAWSTTSPAAGVYVHRLAPSEATAAPTYSVEVSRDDGQPQLFSQGMVSSLQLTLAPRGVLQGVVQHLFGRSDYWADATTLSDPTASTAPRLYGLASLTHQEATAGEGDVYVRVSTPPASSDDPIGVVAKVGTGAYGVNESLVQYGTDSEGRPVFGTLYDSTTGGVLGSRAMPYEVYFENAVDLEVGDEWRFDRARGIWVQALPDLPPFNEIFAAIYFDNEPIRLQQFQITLTPPVAAQFHIGRRFSDEIRRRGTRGVAVTFQREYVDRKVRRRLEAGEPFGLRLECYSGIEFVPGYEHSLTAVLPRLKASGRTPAVNAADSMTESITATAHPDPSNADGFTDDLTLLLTNSVADLAF